MLLGSASAEAPYANDDENRSKTQQDQHLEKNVAEFGAEEH